MKTKKMYSEGMYFADGTNMPSEPEPMIISPADYAEYVKIGVANNWTFVYVG